MRGELQAASLLVAAAVGVALAPWPAAARPGGPMPPVIAGRVVAVVDGATLLVQDPRRGQLRVRLDGVVLPGDAADRETARARLARLAFWREVLIAPAVSAHRPGELAGRAWVLGRDCLPACGAPTDLVAALRPAPRLADRE